MKYLVSLILLVALTGGVHVPPAVAHASVVSSSVSVSEHVSADRKDPKKKKKAKKGNRGKHKGQYKRDGTNKFSSSFISSRTLVDNDGKGKSKGKKKGKKKNGGSVSPRFNGPFRPGTDPETTPVPRQEPPRCVIIEQPIETRVEYRTKTVTERVVYGAGLVALGVMAAGLFFLFLGFILGWRRAGKNEDDFLRSVLHEKE